MKKDIHSYK